MSSTESVERVVAEWWTWDWEPSYECDVVWPPPESTQVYPTEGEARILAEQAADNPSGISMYVEHCVLASNDGVLALSRTRHVVPWRRPYQAHLRGWYVQCIADGYDLLVVDCDPSGYTPRFLKRDSYFSMHSSNTHEAFDVSVNSIEIHTDPTTARFRFRHREAK